MCIYTLCIYISVYIIEHIILLSLVTFFLLVVQKVKKYAKYLAIWNRFAIFAIG